MYYRFCTDVLKSHEGATWMSIKRKGAVYMYKVEDEYPHIMGYKKEIVRNEQ